MALSVNWTLFVANSFVQLVTHSCLKSVKPFHDIPDKKLFAADSIQALESNPILCFTNPEDIPTWNIFGIGISLYFIFLLYSNLDGLIAHFGDDNRFGHGLRCCAIDRLGSTQLLAVYCIEAYCLVIVVCIGNAVVNASFLLCP